MRHLVSTILLISLFLSCYSATGQEKDLPYAEWISKLSVKKDPLNSHYNAVLQEIRFLDSLQLCEVFATLNSRAPKNNIRFQIRLRLMQGRMYPYFPKQQDCRIKRPYEDLLNEA